MLYALREGLRIVLEEGLEVRFARHALNEKALMAGIQSMGLQLYGDPKCKLPMVTCIRIPEGIDGEAVRAMLLEQFGIEIASSFGPLKGKIWRIGTMGFSCRKKKCAASARRFRGRHDLLRCANPCSCRRSGSTPGLSGRRGSC